MVEAGIYRCTLPSPMSQVRMQHAHPLIYTNRLSQPFIADLLSPRSESSSSAVGTILYLAEDAPPDFLLSFADDNGIRIGIQNDN